MAAASHPLDRHFLRNTAGISSVEFLWGLGVPVVIESTFLQLFLRNLGASSFLIGFVPTFFSLGMSLFSLVSGFLTAHLRRKRTAVVLMHAATAVPILSLGIVLGTAGFTSSTLTVFFSAYALFAVGIGMLFPVWQNYLVKIFTDARAIQGMAVMMITQNAAKILASFLLLRVVERYSFSARGASLAFTAVGLLFVAGSLMFLITRETSEAAAALHPSRLRSYLLGVREVLANRNFIRYLGVELEYFALIGVLAFYANYATEYCGVDPAVASGLFVAFNYLGGLLVNILLGWKGLLTIRAKYLLSKALSLIGMAVLCAACTLWAFFLVSFLFGVSRGTRMLVYAPAVKRISGRADATHYFALAPLLTLPVSVGVPLADGKVLDLLAGWGAWSYRSVFMAMGALVALSLFFLARTRFPERSAASGLEDSSQEVFLDSASGAS